MSSITKLSIQGVRSFSPDQKEVIQFGFPLTLIVGQNGTGKTTIIECLKYATTGDLPPNSKGGAFIHDPKITEEKEVKAQVKLAFSNCNGSPMICTRSMQLLVKRTTQTFKTLEGQLVVFNHNEKTTISTKLAELDSQMPFYLGVSKAILDYVIFCHQEDSLWPLSEPTTLKKRFDEIFEALKFTKALDSIKNIRKTLAVEIKILEQSVKHLQADKDKATKAEERKTGLQNQINDFKLEVDDLSKNMEEINEQLARLFKSNQEFQAVVAKIDNLKFSKTSYEDQIRRLENTIQHLHEPNDVLTKRSSNFQKEIEQYKREIDQETRRNENMNKELNRKRDHFSAKIRQEGELKALERRYFDSCEKRKELVKQFSSLINMESVEEITDQVVQEFTKALSTVKTAKENNVNDFTSKTNDKVSEFEHRLRELSNSISNQENLRRYTTADIKKIEDENNVITKKVNDIQFDEGSTEYEKSILENMQSKLKSLKENNTIESIMAKIKDNELQITRLESEIDDINKQISLSSKKSDIYAKVSLLKEDQKYKQKALENLNKKHGENFKRLVSADLDSSICIEKFNGLHEQQETKLSKLNAKREQLQKKLNNAESAHKRTEDDLQSKNKELARAEKTIKNTLPDDVSIDQYEEYLKELEQDYKVAIQNAKLKETTKEFNTKALEIAEKEKFCVLCRRSFNTNELNNFVSLLTDLTKNININDNEEIKFCEEELETARSVSNDISTVRNLARDIPKFKEDSAQLKEELDAVIRERDVALQEIKEEQKLILEIEALKQPIYDIRRTSNDLKNIKDQLDSKQEELSEFGMGNIKTSEELQELQFNKNNEFKKLRSLNKNLNEEREIQIKEVNKLENQVKDKQLYINNLERSLIEKETLKQSQAENARKIEELNKTVTEIELKIKEYSKLEEKIQSEFAYYKQLSSATLAELTRDFNKIAQAFNVFNELNSQIEVYVKQDQNRVAECAKEVAVIDQQITSQEQEITGRSQKISELKNKVANSDKVEKNIRDNLQLRELNERLESVNSEIYELKEQNAEAEKMKYERKSSNLSNQLADLQSQYGGKLGEIKQMENQIRHIKRELKEDYKDINDVYHKEWVTLQTKTLVNDDLFKYSKALDSGIMKYHSIKMQEINKVIDELWHATYRGTDVDTIQIKSDVNLQSKGNRSYNYRVVMKKQHAELDMRGRCSAGQKVLASIIIRLALAECFGINCGMIALDEPTTNLDTENSEGLAQSLGRIIEMRRHQNNFQLIVITHDGKFLTHMSASKYTDHFYRVSRNERQQSEIEWVNITKVGED